MKTGKTLQELAATLERNAEVKTDYVSDTREITMLPTDASLRVAEQELEATDHCHRQLATWSGIGTRYYDKMRADSPALLAGNVNHWLHKDEDKATRRMVRSLDGKARAFLSDRYLRLDNEHVAEAAFRAMEAVQDTSDVKMLSCDVTERRLYLKFAFPKVEGEVAKGDVVQSGVIVRNSEVGLGSFEVYPFLNRLVCLNGMVVTEKGNGGYRRNHIGSKVQSDGVIYRQDTIEAAAQAALLECRDAVTTFADPEFFERQLNRFRDAAQSETVAAPVKAVQVLAKAKGFDFTESEQESILERFIQGQDYSKWGMLNAVTNLANDVDDYDRASDLEVLGGRILDLPKADWHRVAIAA